MPTVENADLRVTVDGDVYEINISDVLEDLTGEETLEVEEFLGGWENFDETGESARSAYLLYFLAKRGHNTKITLKEILKEKGVMFGDRVTLEDLDKEGKNSPPAEGGETPSSASTPSDDSGPGTSPSDTE